MPRQVVHYLDLPPHILHVIVGEELPLRDRLASVLFSSCLLRANKCGTKLALPKLLPQAINCDSTGSQPEGRRSSRSILLTWIAFFEAPVGAGFLTTSVRIDSTPWILMGSGASVVATEDTFVESVPLAVGRAWFSD